MEKVVFEEQLLRRIELVNIILVGLLPLGGWILVSVQTAIGVFLGAAIATASFRVLKWQLNKAFRIPGKLPQKGRVFASYYLRFLATVFLVFGVMYFGWVDPITFLIGLSVVVLSILVGGGLELLVWHARKGES